MYNKYGEDTNHKENAVNVNYNDYTESRGPSAQEKTWCILTKCVMMGKTHAGRNFDVGGRNLERVTTRLTARKTYAENLSMYMQDMESPTKK